MTNLLQDAHSRKISKPVTAPPGTTILVAPIANAWIYVHELMGDLSADGTLDIREGTNVLASFTLDKGQGVTEQDEPGNDNVPRFQARPGNNFNIVVTGGTFNGTIDYSIRY